MTRTRGLLDSPSKQLMRDLIKDLEQVRLHNTELKKVKEYERRSFYEYLDRVDREREEVHNTALNAVAAKRDQLRHEAEETLQQHLREVEEERKRKEEEERKRKEKLEREKAERERREREEAARQEAERKAKEEAKRRQAEEAERLRKAKEEQEEKARKEREHLEQERKKQEEVKKQQAQLKAQEEQKAAQEKQQLTQQTFSGEARRTPEEIAEHKRYLELHKSLKQFRQGMVEETKKNPMLKQHMGDMRRAIKKCVGQLLTEDKVANKKPTNEIITILRKAATLQEPSIDIRQFIAFPPPQIANEPAKVPALLIYLLNIFAKAILSQLVAEAGVTPKSAGPLGVLTAQIFSMDSFVYKGTSMIDILLAKYHVLCPVLWGFYGSESNDAGKVALGWWREEPNGPFVSRQVHEERMIGLGAGFAAIGLRDFSKTTRQNPLPNTHYWKALAMIVNVPAAEVQDTHLTVLGAMLQFSAPRAVGFWGDLGLLALRHAIVTFPATLPRTSSARSSVEILRDLYARDHHILI